jgi:amino acid transporter
VVELKNSEKGRFGSFAGVFTPNVLTILGIILFLRTGWVVGQAGLAGALFIIVIANLISLFTGLSLSLVATNMHVKTGGAYYMISRTLGLEIGGAIGIPLYISQAISAAFYIIGFTEAVTSVFSGIDPVFLSVSLALFFGFLAFIGADFTLKIQFVILGILLFAILSFFSGGWGEWYAPGLYSTSTSRATFGEVFAIFFPAVTGIMVGVSMSGDLKEPAKSIPRGTLSSIGITAFIYIAAAIWMGLHATTMELVTDNLIMQKIARWPQLVLLGVWASTLSSALGSVLAAPRTLQALSFDRIVPKVLSAQLGSRTEPRCAVIITTSIAIMIILMGDLNFVAPIISMFFLNTYGMINLTAGVELLVGNPSFRPQFNVHWAIPLVGGFGCYGAMFLISPMATVIAISISCGIYIYLKQRSLRQNWGDIRSGLWFSIARFGLIRLEASPQHARNWRPNIVAFTGAAGISHSREQLLEMASWLSSGQGVVTLYHLLVGDIDDLAGRGLQEASRNSLRKYLDEEGVIAFTECSIVSDFYQGVYSTIQAHGITGIEPNTVLLGLSKKPDIQKKQFHLMRKLISLEKSTLFLHFNSKRGYGKKKLIDIWWRGKDRNAELMLLLAHIISQSAPWEGSKIRVLRLLDHEEGRSSANEHIQRLIESSRMEAEPIVLVKSDLKQKFKTVFNEQSKDTDLVLLGAAVPEVEKFDSTINFLQDLLQSAPSVLFVRSAETEDILELEPVV